MRLSKAALVASMVAVGMSVPALEEALLLAAAGVTIICSHGSQAAGHRRPARRRKTWSLTFESDSTAGGEPADRETQP